MPCIPASSTFSCDEAKVIVRPCVSEVQLKVSTIVLWATWPESEKAHQWKVSLSFEVGLRLRQLAANASSLAF